MNTDARLTAKLLSACPPDSAQKEKLEDVLSKKYGKAVELVWQEDRTAQGGFRIELGSEVIDWTAEGRLEQLKERLTGLKSEGSVIPLIRDAVKSWVPEVCAREVGSVLTVADGIAYVEGLEGATYGEILLFEGGIRGMVQELRGVSPKAPDLYDAFVVTMGDGARIEGIKLVEELRAAGLKSDLDHAARSMKAQFKYANKVGVKKVVVIAGDELEKGVVKLRDMENSTEEEVARGEIVARLLGEKK